MAQTHRGGPPGIESDVAAGALSWVRSKLVLCCCSMVASFVSIWLLEAECDDAQTDDRADAGPSRDNRAQVM